MLGEVLAQVVDAFLVRLETLDLRVRDEDDPVTALEDELAARVVEDLSGNGIEMKARLEIRGISPSESGRKSKKRVRSVSVASEIIFPFASGLVRS